MKETKTKKLNKEPVGGEEFNYNGKYYRWIQIDAEKTYLCKRVWSAEDEDFLTYYFVVDFCDNEILFMSDDFSCAKRFILNEDTKDLKESYSLEEDLDVIEFSEAQPVDCVLASATAVMAAYQNANKWLDSVKEVIYTKLSCPFFSNYVHELAHTMPQRFDAFGDILHTVNMEIPYPATTEIPRKPETIQESFDIIFGTLDAIKLALNAFIKCTDENYHGMACSAEDCLNDIEKEYPMLFRLQQKANECGEDTITFDKFVGQYQEHKGDLLEGVKTKKGYRQNRKS